MCDRGSKTRTIIPIAGAQLVQNPLLVPVPRARLPEQSHDLDYPDFYDSLYRLVTSDMMYAKYRARFFRMVDLCLSSSHVPAYVVAAFLKRFAR